MFGFLKKHKEKSNESQNLITEDILTRLIEDKVESAMRDFQFLDSVDILEKKVMSGDLLYAKLKLKHKNGDSVEGSVTNSSMFFRTSLHEMIDSIVTQNWKFEFEDLVNNLRKSSQIIEEFYRYESDHNVIALTYLGTRYRMPIFEVIKFDDKLRESNLDPIYEKVRIMTKSWMNEYGHSRHSMNIYGIAKWLNDIQK